MILTKDELAVLATLDREFCYGYSWIDGTNGLDRKGLAPIIKHLKELKLIEFHRGLMNDDGEVCGSGWCRSVAGDEEVEDNDL